MRRRHQRRTLPRREPSARRAVPTTRWRRHAVAAHFQNARSRLSRRWVVPGRYYEKVKALKLTRHAGDRLAAAIGDRRFHGENGGYDSLPALAAPQFRRENPTNERCGGESIPAEIKLTRPTGGFLLWIELPKSLGLEAHERALVEKISIEPGPMFSATQSFQNFIRLSCGHRGPRFWSASGESSRTPGKKLM